LKKKYNVYSLGDNALSIVFAEKIDELIHEKILNLAQQIQAKPFLGLEDVVSSYTTLSVFYDVLKIKKYHPEAKTAFDFVVNYIEQLNDDQKIGFENQKNIIEIPVFYNGEDLDFVAEFCQLSIDEIIKIHTIPLYKVYMIGFLPGFPYLGGLDERLFVPRKSTPRTSVPKGSVGLAGVQTGIYPQKSPGGWQLIGQTEVNLFNKNPLPQSLLKVGDFVKFVSI
jgi:inhibitor of KinA